MSRKRIRLPKITVSMDEKLAESKTLEEFEKVSEFKTREPVMVYKAGYQARQEACVYLLHSKRGYPFWVTTFQNLFFDTLEKKWYNRTSFNLRELYVIRGLIDKAISFITKRELSNPYFLKEHGPEAIQAMKDSRITPEWLDKDVGPTRRIKGSSMPKEVYEPAEAQEGVLDSVEAFILDMERGDDEDPLA